MKKIVMFFLTMVLFLTNICCLPTDIRAIVAEDETTGEVAAKKVIQTYVNETNELVHIGINGETISATPSHPFYVYKFGWTLAGSQKPQRNILRAYSSIIIKKQ